jgi:hypothetical protein
VAGVDGDVAGEDRQAGKALVHDGLIGTGDLGGAVAAGEEHVSAEDHLVGFAIQDDVGGIMSGQVHDLEGVCAQGDGVALVEPAVRGNGCDGEGQILGGASGILQPVLRQGMGH